MANGETLKNGEPPKIVYDMVHYKDDGSVNESKSFISPDDHPSGSKASVPSNIRNACWEYHKGQFPKKQVQAVVNDLVAPPPPPPPPLNTGVKKWPIVEPTVQKK
jgi:hypothetical protein